MRSYDIERWYNVTDDSGELVKSGALEEHVTGVLDSLILGASSTDDVSDVSAGGALALGEVLITLRVTAGKRKHAQSLATEMIIDAITANGGVLVQDHAQGSAGSSARTWKPVPVPAYA